ncbi:MAG TPA: hypothetical protein VK815_17215, partial [Candidatus Acidoferrales bacterium]|nr:hypothetical protein [Candidatus Acidoferrales bacterium]
RPLEGGPGQEGSGQSLGYQGSSGFVRLCQTLEIFWVRWGWRNHQFAPFTIVYHQWFSFFIL